jgi:hypothetical protein
MQFCMASCYFPPFELREIFSGNRKSRDFLANGTGQMKWYQQHRACIEACSLAWGLCCARTVGLSSKLFKAQVVPKLPLPHSPTSSAWMETSVALSTGDV